MIIKAIKSDSIIDDLPLDNIIEMITLDDKLPAGFVTSPSISNAILYDFDIVIDKYCEANSIIYTRYSDDLIFSSNKILNNIENEINNILQRLYDKAFELNLEKSQFLDKTKRVQILGLIITPDNHITVPRNEKNNIKKLIYFYINDRNKFDNFLKDNYNNSLAKAYGKLNYINDIDINYIQYLRTKYGNFVIDQFLHGDKRIG
jgi:RNA-directed DNA polymerase